MNAKVIVGSEQLFGEIILLGSDRDEASEIVEVVCWQDALD